MTPKLFRYHFTGYHPSTAIPIHVYLLPETYPKIFEVCETRNIFMKPYANHENGHFFNGLLTKLLGLMRVFIYHKIIKLLLNSLLDWRRLHFAESELSHKTPDHRQI